MKTSIDWAEVRSRLQRAERRLEQAFAPGWEETQRILKERAVRLATPPDFGPDGERIELVAFKLAHETWCIESAFVREIWPLTEWTPVPCTPPFVLGIVSLRGQIFSVIDLRQFFDLPDRGLTDLNRIILLQSGEMTFGILADAILGVCDELVADIQPSLPALTGIREKYLRGITRDREVVLDGARLIHDQGIVVKQYGDRSPEGVSNP